MVYRKNEELIKTKTKVCKNKSAEMARLGKLDCQLLTHTECFIDVCKGEWCLSANLKGETFTISSDIDFISILRTFRNTIFCVEMY